MKKTLTALAWAAMFGLSANAQAAIITYNFTGTVNSIHSDPGDPLGAEFSFGQSVSGSFTLDHSVVDANSDPDLGEFYGNVVSIDVTVGSYAASGAGGDGYTATIFDPYLGFFTTKSGGAFDGSATVVGADVGGLEFGSISILSSEALGSDAFPSPFAPSDLSLLQAFLEFQNESSEIFATGFMFDTLTIESEDSVPGPGALALLGFGLLGLGVRRRAHKR